MITLAAAHEVTVNHECGHAAAAVLLGTVPIRVEVGGHPEVAGRVSFQPEQMDRAAARRRVLILMAGSSGADEDPPAWPPNEEAPRKSDEWKLAKLAKYLDLDASSYARLRAQAWELAARPGFRALEAGFREALRHRHILDAPAIARVLFAAMEAEQVAALYRHALHQQEER